MTPSAHESEVTRFVHALIIKGGWLDEVNRGLALELRPEDYPGELLLHAFAERMPDDGDDDRRKRA